jgi:AcrR family transcriptional regulator
MRQAIIDAALDQLAVTGADGLSVREVARKVGMSSSAIYRHIPSKDALLTALIIEGYESLGRAAEVAEGAIPRPAFTARFLALGRAVRRWAQANPHHYALLFGSPVPGYSAPEDTIEPATQITRLLSQVLVEASAAGSLRAPDELQVDTSLLEPDVLSAFLPGLPEEIAIRGILAWSSLFGLVSFELFGHLVGSVADNDAFFDTSLGVLCQVIGLEAAPA